LSGHKEECEKNSMASCSVPWRFAWSPAFGRHPQPESVSAILRANPGAGIAAVQMTDIKTPAADPNGRARGSSNGLIQLRDSSADRSTITTKDNKEDL